MVIVLTVLLGNHLRNKADAVGELPPISDEVTVGSKDNSTQADTPQ